MIRCDNKSHIAGRGKTADLLAKIPGPGRTISSPHRVKLFFNTSSIAAPSGAREGVRAVVYSASRTFIPDICAVK